MDTDCFSLYVGIDWGDAQHQVCMLSDPNHPKELQVKHGGRALADLAMALAHDVWGQNHRVAVAIEVDSGPVVESLLLQGFAVYSINPRQLDRLRDRYFPSGAKDDRRDALVLAQSLRTDRQLFKRVEADDPDTITLRHVTRARDELQRSLQRTTNRLRNHLAQYFPALLQLSPDASDPLVWALIERAPDPEAAAKLSIVTIAKIVKDLRIRRVSPQQIRDVLREPPVQLLPGARQALAQRALTLIPQIRLFHEQFVEHTRAMERQIADRCQPVQEPVSEPAGEPALEAPAPDQSSKPSDAPTSPAPRLSDAAILRSMVGIGAYVLAVLLTEATRAIARRDLAALRAQTGIAPVTRQSGHSLHVSMRRACSWRLQKAAYCWGMAAIQNDPLSKAHYQRLRASGHTHARALRGVVDRLLDVLITMLRDGTLYDPERRRELQNAA
jgi:transposase